MISLLLCLLSLAIAIWLFWVAFKVAVAALKIVVIFGGIFILIFGCAIAFIFI